MVFGLSSTRAAPPLSSSSSRSTPVDVLSIISSSSQTNNFTHHPSANRNISNNNYQKGVSTSTSSTDERRSVLQSTAYVSLFQLSSEWNEGADRLDKNQLEEDNLCRINSRRRHSLFDPNGLPTIPTHQQLQQTSIDRRRSLAVLHTSPSSQLTHLEGLAKGADKNSEQHSLQNFHQQSGRNRCPNIVLNLAEEEEEGEQQSQKQKEERAEHPSSSCTPLFVEDHNHNHIGGACSSDFSCFQKQPIESDLLSPEEEAMFQRRVARGQSRCLSSAGLGSEGFSRSQNFAKRRNSVSFGVVEEIAEDETETVTQIGSIDEDEVYVDSLAGNPEREVILVCPTKDAQFLTLEQKQEEADNKAREDSPLDIPTFSKSKAMRKAKKAGLMANYGNVRSDSVDSGFSCASLSSCSSTESSVEDPGSLQKARMIRQRSMSIQPESISIAKSVDYPAWLRSVKKLVQLTMQLRQEEEDNKDETISSLEQLAGQHRQDVENVKKFVRHNDWPVSHEIRADLWRVLCHTKDFESNKSVYLQQLEDLTRSGVKTLRPSFLSLDGIVVADHGLKEEGAVTLQRLLIVIECVRPEIRFVPILYPCVPCNTFILSSELAVFASCHTLLSLLKKHKRSVYSMLKRRAGTVDDVKLAEIFTHWNAWIFKYLPFEYLVRVIDCFLVEGHKMLLRVTLSLVYLWYKDRSKEPNSGTDPVSSRNSATQRRHFPLIRSSTLPTRSKPPTAPAGLPNDSSAGSVDERIAEINNQIIHLAENCPISVQTLLDMGCAIRNFKHSTFEQRQKHYETSFERSIYTAAFESKIIDTEAASELIAALPSRYQLETPQLLFRLSEHGASFVQLWTQIDDADQTLLVIRSVSGQIFGAYCSSCWTERRDVRERAKTRYFGTGESFVWHLHPELQLPVVYGWAGQNSDHPDSCPQMFMTAGDRFLIIGSGGGDAIAIRDELTRGLSYPCETFASPALVPSNEFEIDELEVYMVIVEGVCNPRNWLRFYACLSN
uniref:TLDc domain-containing protein n=1 Tax=Ditylenchus dipsaci TaxID=166011 RepID=A0A915DZ55_9BILA